MVELIWEKSGVVRRATGLVTADELEVSAATLQANHRIDDLRYIIHDFSGCEQLLVGDDDIEFMAIRASLALQRNARVRIVFVGDQPAVQALIDTFNTHCLASVRCHRVATMEAARQFIAA